MTSVVIVEDELDIGDLIALYCRREGWDVSQVCDGADAIDTIRARQPDFIVLDVGLPNKDGFQVCKELRQFSQVPLLFLTARQDEIDRIVGLELGADDYVTKPFSPRELIARIKAILRRGNNLPESKTKAIFGELAIDLERRECKKGDEAISLASQEVLLLEVFLEHQGIALSRQQLLDLAWGEEWVGDARTVDVHVRQLRKKLGDDLPLETVRGHGYRFS